MNRDGSGLRRLTNNPSIDITPTWSPSGTQIAFTSDRSGSPQIYVVGADGLNLSKKTSESYRDRPDVVARAVQRDRVRGAQRTGLRHPGARPGDERHASRITFGEGTNESPAFSPNSRHIVFTSTRSGQDAGVHDRARRQGRQADYESRQQLRTGLVQMTGASTMKAARSDRRHWLRSRPSLTAAACGKKTPPVARPMPPPPPPVDDQRRPAAGSARAGPAEPVSVPPDPVRRRRDCVGVARRAQQELTAAAGVLRAGQQRFERRQSAHARRRRGAASSATPAGP